MLYFTTYIIINGIMCQPEIQVSSEAKRKEWYQPRHEGREPAAP